MDAKTQLSSDAVQRIAEITADLVTTKDKAKIAALSQEMQALTEGESPLCFKATPSEDGYKLESLVYNENKPNISVLVKKYGTVDLSGSKARPATIPESFPTFVYRNYAIVKDGIVNVKLLPVKASKATMDEVIFLSGPEILAYTPVFDTDTDTVEAVMNLDSLPVINQKMTDSVKADKLFDLEYRLFVAQSKAKVYKALLS